MDRRRERERENKARQLVLRTTDPPLPRLIFDIEHFEKNKNLRGKLKGELLDHFLDHYSPANKSREPQRKQYRSVNQYHLSLSLSLSFLSSRIHGRREQLPRVDVHGILHRRRNPIRTERSSPLPPMSIRFQTYLHPYETGEGGTKVSAITQFPIRRYSSTGTRGVGIITD